MGDLLEGIVLHAFDGKVPFDEKGLKVIQQLRSLYELNLTYEDSHKLVES